MTKRAWLIAALTMVGAGCGELDLTQSSSVMLEVQVPTDAPTLAGLTHVRVELALGGAIHVVDLAAPLPALEELVLDGEGAVVAHATGFGADEQVLAVADVTGVARHGESLQLTLMMSAPPARPVAKAGPGQPVVLTVVRQGTGTGIVTSNPAGIACSPTCSASFPFGSTVTLVATPAVGSAFVSWSDGCTGSAPTCTVTMSGAKTVKASFGVLTYGLSVMRAGLGSGSVTSSPAGISCGSDCSESYAYGTVVTLVASPAPGSAFAGWSGACSGTGACNVTMTAARGVTANFVPVLYPLNVTLSGAGTVVSSPSGISCGSTCSAVYSYGAVVTLTATPMVGYTFAGWSGACAGTGPCNVTMTAARSVTATFTPQLFALSVTRSGNGSVASAPAGISCGLDCTESYPYSTTVTLIATPAPGSVFVGWAGACAGNGTCSVSMTAARSVTAVFLP